MHNQLKWKTVMLVAALLLPLVIPCRAEDAATEQYIKWVDFNITAAAMKDACTLDVETHESEHPISWITALAYLGQKYGGKFSGYKKSDLEDFAQKIAQGEPPEATVTNEKLFRYYLEAYGAALGGLVGDYDEVTIDDDGTETVTHKYGLRGFSPVAAGYDYNHYDDFGASRSYGYRRNHLGHDLMGSVGTPIIAVESGYVEACGWNQYGGWRIGLRSFDGKRYYYYAHLRKNHPYNDIYEGKIVHAGEVIGYLGMTGYSAKENTNNIDTPHLHYGLELIFHPSQKDGYCQIWLDMYALTDFLYQNRAATRKNSDGTESVSRRYAVYAETPD